MSSSISWKSCVTMEIRRNKPAWRRVWFIYSQRFEFILLRLNYANLKMMYLMSFCFCFLTNQSLPIYHPGGPPLVLVLLTTMVANRCVSGSVSACVHICLLLCMAVVMVTAQRRSRGGYQGYQTESRMWSPPKSGMRGRNNVNVRGNVGGSKFTLIF